MPARLRDLKRAAESFGVVVTEHRSGSSHFKFTAPSGASFPIAAHNGLKEEIEDFYIRRLCRVLGLDEKALRAKL